LRSLLLSLPPVPAAAADAEPNAAEPESLFAPSLSPKRSHSRKRRAEVAIAAPSAWFVACSSTLRGEQHSTTQQQA
jgi:hypothetical protein